MTVIDQTRIQAPGGPTLGTATAHDVSHLKRVLAAAFHEDPIFGWLMPEEATREARLRRFFELELRYVALPRGCAWTSSALSGAALCLPPDAWRLPTRILVTQGPSLARAFGARLPRAAGLLAATRRDCRRTSRRAASATPPFTRASVSSLRMSCASPAARRCGSCFDHP
jgi:hypothetical protein